MRTHFLIRRSTEAFIVAVLIAVGYSLSMAQSAPLKDTWQAVEPELVPANIAGKKIRIKVGASYKLVKYDAAEQAKLGFQYLYKPREANAKRVLTVYDISRFSLNDWITIDQATSSDEDPPLTALLKAVGDNEYIGTPIKWNKQLGVLMRAAVSLEEEFPEIKASMSLKVLADDVLTHAAYNQATRAIKGKMTGEILNATRSNFKRAGINYDDVAMGWTSNELKSMMAGDPAPMMAKENMKPIYMAFDREFEHLSIKPFGKVISVSGVGGQMLGYTHPAWPTEPSD